MANLLQGFSPHPSADDARGRFPELASEFLQRDQGAAADAGAAGVAFASGELRQHRSVSGRNLEVATEPLRAGPETDDQAGRGVAEIDLVDCAGEPNAVALWGCRGIVDGLGDAGFLAELRRLK